MTTEWVMSMFPPNSEKARWITLQTVFSYWDPRVSLFVAEFEAMIQQTMRYFTDTDIPKLYNETKNDAMESLKKNNDMSSQALI